MTHSSAHAIRRPATAWLARAGLLLAASLAVLAACSTDSGPGRRAGGSARALKAKACIDCHAPVAKQLARKQVHAPFKDQEKCEVCHRRHGVVGVNVLQKDEADLCFSCHEAQKQAFATGTVHKAIQGSARNKCTSCHAPHASDFPGLLRVSVNDACFSCHRKAEFQGTKPHAPAARSCAECHVPHAGPQDHLLAKDEKALCGKCHDGGGAKMKAAHGDLPVAAARCTGCHSPHAAAEPKGLLPTVHQVASECSSCHAPGKGKPFAVAKAAPALCVECHDDQAKDLKRKVAHPPAETCTDCHSPHATRAAKLLKKEEKALCAECHAEVTDKLAKGGHAPAAQGKCASCHAPHGADGAKLLARTAPALCLGCHKPAEAWLKAKTVHAPVQSGTCGDCHDPHGSGQAKLLVKDEATLCFGCHQDLKKLATGEGVHEPVRTGKCAACHDPHGSGQAKLLVAATADVCNKCHDFKKRYEKAKLHDPVASGDCAECHKPHQSDQPALLKQKVGALCASCHEDVQKGLEAKGVASSHAPVRNGQCAACHEPHGAKDKPFLKKDRLALCGDCHGELTKRLARTNAPSHSPAKDGSCDACHAGHRSAQPSLLAKAQKDLCADCHDAKDADLVKKHGGYSLEKARCLGCHDPHYGDKKDLVRRVAHAPFVNRDCGSCHTAPRPGANQPALVAKGRALCEICHGDTRQTFAKKHVHTAVKREQCVACHAPHASASDKLLAQRGADLCFQCHDRKPFSARAQHAPVKQGQCVKCHDPHASDSKGLLAKSGNDLCLGCHDAQRKELAAKHVHSALQGGSCTDCHNPHGSPYPAMLVASREKLCLNCHDVRTASLQRAHQGFPLAGVDCASCHNPHGSNQPNLVRNNTHKTFGACARCHQATGPKPKTLLATSPALCFRCHGDKKAEVSAKTGVHAAAQGDCTDCHTPHASDEKGLVKGNKERAVCLSCHDELRTTLERSKSIHPLKAAGGRCTACHRPHASPEGHLLAQPIGNLCLGCHKTHTQFSHPIGKGTIDPNTGKDMTCLSCHSPHGTSQDHVLLDNPARALCIRCHDGASENPREMRKPGAKRTL